jgi:two-component system NtrC family sensor kinase
MPQVPSERLAWELATESIVVKIRWFGIVMGYVLVQTRTGLYNPSAVRAFLALGAGYAALDTVFFRMGEVFLKRAPLFVSLMESLFIMLLCYHDTGLDSPFRWYYLLSLICCAIRYSPTTAWLTFGCHTFSILALYLSLSQDRGALVSSLPLTLAILAWVTWASSSLAAVLRDTGTRLAETNQALERNRDELERRVQERSEALRASQARMIQHEKMAAFGLLSAGIAHEVGNPLAALSSLVQMLRRHQPDAYAAEKLDLAGRQLDRIQRTIRELITFARPASTAVARFALADAVDDALGIAKYYHRTKQPTIINELGREIPPLRGVRDHVTQVVLNLVINAIDATASKGGTIHLTDRGGDGWIELSVADDGQGIAPADQIRMFQAYFTTKPRGTGLGLFVCRQIVSEMGGTLVFRSVQGEGTCFVLRLPTETSPAPVAMSLTPAGSATGRAEV